MYITTVFVRLIVVLSYGWSYGRHMTNRPTNFEVIYWLYVSYDQTMSNDSTAVSQVYYCPVSKIYLAEINGI